MIQNIFLPEKIGNYYLFKKKVLGIDIGQQQIRGTVVTIKGTKRIIEKYIEVPIELSNNNHVEPVKRALQKILESAGKIHEIRSALSSSHIIFKELRLPFTDHEQIAQVIRFEVEPLLPFALEDSVLDFIVTYQSLADKESQVLVACVKKSIIEEHLKLFEPLTSTPTRVIVDLFSLYSLYREIYTQQNGNQNVILLDVGLNNTQIAYIQQHQLRFIRILPQGITHILKNIHNQLSLSNNEIYEKIKQLPFAAQTDDGFNRVANESFLSLVRALNFTLTSFINQAGDTTIEKILVVGEATYIKPLCNLITQELSIACESFDIRDLEKIAGTSLSKNVSIPLRGIISTATALPLDTTQYFNLVATSTESKKSSLFAWQIITILMLSLILLGSLFAFYIIETGKLKKEAHNSVQEVVAQLKARFKKLSTTSENRNESEAKKLNEVEKLAEMIQDTQEIVEAEKELWFAFSYANQARYLQYLLELNTRIDRQALGFVINKITIGEGVLILQAQVKDHESLKLLERQLRASPFFELKEPQEDPIFTMPITLKSTDEEL